jgi:hypothetical protein
MEKRSLWVNCWRATSSKSWSTIWGFRAFSMIPWAMTDKGASWANRSKMSLRIIAAASADNR